MLDLYLGGTEIPSHRNLLAEMGAPAVSLSYMGLRRRTKFVRPWSIADKYPETQKVFLDSGAYTVNKNHDDYEPEDLLAIAEHYRSLVESNIDALDMVSEFDAVALGRDWIEQQRDEFWSQIPEDKFLPIWHPDTGLDELARLAQQYTRVGVSSTDHNGRNLTPTFNGLVQQYGTKLHGVNMSKVDEMSTVRWASISTISWLSPAQYGDTIVWTGKELKRYPKAYKEKARKQHRTLFTNNGFDAEAIAADDAKEVLRLSAWSWMQLAENIDRHSGGANIVTMFSDTPPPPNTELGGSEVDTLPSEERNNLPTLRLRDDDERTPLPVIGLQRVTETFINPESQKAEERDVDHIRSRSQSMRLCRSCFLAAKCPAYDPEANCAYDIPVEIKGKDQFRSAYDALIEMQYQRVLFMKMAEDLEGGYADPNLSSEIDRLQKMLKTKADLEQEGFSLKIEAKERGQMGMISRLFGRDAGESARALPATVDLGDLAEASGFIVEGEIVG
jgi:hypothetical protein